MHFEKAWVSLVQARGCGWSLGLPVDATSRCPEFLHGESHFFVPLLQKKDILHLGSFVRPGLGLHVQGPLQSRSHSEARGRVVEIF